MIHDNLEVISNPVNISSSPHRPTGLCMCDRIAPDLFADWSGGREMEGSVLKELRSTVSFLA